MVLLPLLGNFADISYLEENFKLPRIKMYAGALHSNSLLYMLPYQIQKKKQKSLSYHKNCLTIQITHSRHAGYLSYT